MPVTVDQIKHLTDKHILRYATRLKKARLGVPGYRENELEYYLSLWKGIETKKYDVTKLTPDEKVELRDAMMDEGYDDVDII